MIVGPLPLPPLGSRPMYFSVTNSPWRVSSPSWHLSKPSKGQQLPGCAVSHRNTRSHAHVPTAIHFFCSKLCSLVQYDAVCDTMSVDQTFCKLLDYSAGWDFRVRESKSVPRIHVNSSQDQSLSLLSGNQIATKWMLGLFNRWCHWSSLLANGTFISNKS